MTGPDALAAAIAAGENVEVAAAAEPWLLHPHCLEYEKTFFPFVLISKKKYVGMKYDAGKTKGKFTSMGIVLKRRDNPPILKRIYGDMIDGLMKGTAFRQIVARAREQTKRLLRRTSDAALDDLVVTKRLRTGYKNPEQIAHYRLAKRIAERDPGNAPKSNDRIPYVFFVNPGARLQGDRIETPRHIAEAGLRVDYEHYVRNVIMKPVSQVLALRMEELPGYDAAAWRARLANLAGKRRCGAKTDGERRRAEITKIARKLEKDIGKLNARLELERPEQPVPDAGACRTPEQRAQRKAQCATTRTAARGYGSGPRGWRCSRGRSGRSTRSSGPSTRPPEAPSWRANPRRSLRFRMIASGTCARRTPRRWSL